MGIFNKYPLTFNECPRPCGCGLHAYCPFRGVEAIPLSIRYIQGFVLLRGKITLRENVYRAEEAYILGFLEDKNCMVKIPDAYNCFPVFTKNEAMVIRELAQRLHKSALSKGIFV